MNVSTREVGGSANKRVSSRRSPDRLADSKLPTPEECVIPEVLRRRAESAPEEVFVVFDDGSEWSNAAVNRFCDEAAAGLQRLGVKAGDRVLSWLPNGPWPLRVWFGSNRLGAVYTPINTSYRGRLLEHVIQDSGAEVAVVHADLLQRLLEINTHGLRNVVVVGGQTDVPILGVHVHPGDALSGKDGHLEPCPAMPWDPYALIYTSGTTGTSKGVVCSYTQVWASAMAVSAGLDESDRFLVHLPLFHAGGTIAVAGAIALDASCAVTAGFRTDTFWDTVRRTGATAATILGTMATFLLKQAPQPEDASSPLRSAYVIPVIDGVEQFATRFGCKVYTCFNMTEVSVPLVSHDPLITTGSCGRARPGVEVQLVDEHDQPVEPGLTGELVIRTAMPWTLSTGYWNRPEATADSWRNGWFHTGDAFRVAPDGNYHFVDRVKDCIRRRGENISSFEVEVELLGHPAVLDAAVFGVPSEYGEDDVMAVVSPAPDRNLDPLDLTEFMRQRVAHFMIPRYIRFVSELPKTPTAKVEKHRLRAAGITADTWDREAAGVAVKRERLR